MVWSFICLYEFLEQPKAAVSKYHIVSSIKIFFDIFNIKYHDIKNIINL